MSSGRSVAAAGADSSASGRASYPDTQKSKAYMSAISAHAVAE